MSDTPDNFQNGDHNGDSPSIAQTPMSERAPPQAERHMLEELVCPVTQGQLRYDAERQELISRTAHLAYPIRQGIPIMIESEAREIE